MHGFKYRQFTKEQNEFYDLVYKPCMFFLERLTQYEFFFLQKVKYSGLIQLSKVVAKKVCNVNM